MSRQSQTPTGTCTGVAVAQMSQGPGITTTWYASNIIGGGSPLRISITLTGTQSGTPNFEAYAAEYSGIRAVNPLDYSVSAAGYGITNMDSGFATSTQASELIYGYVWNDDTVLPNPPFITRRTDYGNFIADQIVKTTGYYHVTGYDTSSKNANWVCQMAMFRAG